MRFRARGAGYQLFLLASGEAVLHLPQQQSRPGKRTVSAAESLQMNLLGARPLPPSQGLGELPGRINYFLGNDRAQWRANIPTFAKVQFQSVYPGVDLIYYGHQNRLEYDFIVAPGADPKVIRLAFKGQQTLRLSPDGDLVLNFKSGAVRLRKPTVYQDRPGGRQAVASAYCLKGKGQVGIEVGPYDPTRALVIDPILVYSTYLGGTADDLASAVAIDAAGNAYLAGTTASTNFPTTTSPLQGTNGGGARDVFVTKLNATGTQLIYSTYLGGSGNDQAAGLALDNSGNVYLTGQTDSANFPVPSSQSATHNVEIVDFTFVPANISVLQGDRITWTNRDEGESGRHTVTSIDGTGKLNSALLAQGQTYTVTFDQIPNSPAYQYHCVPHPFMLGSVSVFARQTSTPAGGIDAFVVKLNSTGASLVYSNYLGGSGTDVGADIAVDTAGNAYVTGNTSSTNFPTTTGALKTNYTGGTDAQDGFVTKFNAAGSERTYSTYLGGASTEILRGIAVDAAGNAYLTGNTVSANFPTTANAFQSTKGAGSCTILGCPDAFVAKLAPTGQSLVYSTFLGGTDMDDGLGIAVDNGGNAFVTGQTFSTNFPTTATAFQAALAGPGDGFLTQLNATGTGLLYSTYLGGSENDFSARVALTNTGMAYLTGGTRSTNFPLVSPMQVLPGGPIAAFVAKVDPMRAGANSLRYATYLGPSDGGAGLAVDNAGHAYVVGGTNALTFPTTAGAFRAANAGGFDAFVAKINDGTPCSYNLSASSRAIAASGGPGSVSVTTTNNCAWAASSNDSWLTITAGQNGSGTGTVNYSVAAHTGASGRAGTLVIAGQTFTVNQAGVAAGPTTIIRFSPNRGKVGSVMTIIGTNLDQVIAVTFAGGRPGENLNLISPNALSVTVPRGARTGGVRIITQGNVVVESSQSFRVLR